jgi:hypothetical protein
MSQGLIDASPPRQSFSWFSENSRVSDGRGCYDQAARCQATLAQYGFEHNYKRRL